MVSALYRDPVSSRVFPNKAEYQSYLNMMAFYLSNLGDRAELKESRIAFNAAYDDLHKSTSVDEILKWFANNSERTLYSPIAERSPSGGAAYQSFDASIARYVPKGEWQHYPYRDYELDFRPQGSAWEVNVMISMSSRASPRFSVPAQMRAFNTLGLYPSGYPEFLKRTGSILYYGFTGLIMAGEWMDIALLEKLKGNISGEIIYKTT